MLIIDIADNAVMLPAAGAIAGWLAAGRAWKATLYWCLVFGIGLSIVALTKIAFLGWATEIPSLSFKALSGHALRATVVMPVLFFVVLQQAPPYWRTAGVIFGLLCSICIGALLVHFRFHTGSEVMVSSLLGIALGFGFIRSVATLPAPRLNSWTVPLSLTAFILIFSLEPSSMNRLLVDAALYLSNRDHPYTWSEK